MATTASDATLHSPRASAPLEGSVTAPAAPATIHSPQYRRRGMSSPWTQIVRGPDIELTIPAAVSSSAATVVPVVASSPPLSPPLPAADDQTMTAGTSFSPEDDAQPEGNVSGGGTAKKAWNKPSNGSSSETAETAVMGAVSWPALSESTRASPKSSSSSDLSKTLLDGSNPVPQGTTAISPPAIKQGPSNANSSSTPNHPPNRARPVKRSGGNPSNNSSSNGAISQLPSPRGSAAEINPGNSGRHGNSADSLSRDNTHRDGGPRSQSHSGNEHQHQRNSYRRGGGGPHPRGDGPHHGYGARRGDQDRGNQDWNSNRSFGGRDAQVQQRVATRPFMRGPTPTPPQPFFPPAAMPMRPIGTPIVYPEMSMSPVFYVPAPHPDSLRALSVVPQMPPMFFPFPDPQLHAKVVNQIDYYFSNENLIKDTFLRQNMDDQGWVPIKLIASFKKVIQLTDNIPYILDSVRSSSVVEVEGEKVRRRNDWGRWIMPTSVQYPSVSSPQKASQDVLATSFQSIGLDDKTAKHGYSETYLSPSSSGEWSSISQQSSGEKTGQMGVQAGFPLSAPTPSK